MKKKCSKSYFINADMEHEMARYIDNITSDGHSDSQRSGKTTHTAESQRWLWNPHSLRQNPVTQQSGDGTWEKLGEPKSLRRGRY